MKQYQYGLDINKLGECISTPKETKTDAGTRTLVIDLPEYRLEMYSLGKGKKVAIHPKEHFETTFFVEKGSIEVSSIALSERGVISFGDGKNISVVAKEKSVVYVFSGPAEDTGTYGKLQKVQDYRDKYWGEIETVVSKGGYSGKRMVVKKGKCASLEFHCKKLETYYVHSGKLLLRLRAGRGEDRFFDLPEGSVTVTPPGLMHQRGGLEDTVIIEIATKDDDSDSFLVEDGAKHKMPELDSHIRGERPLSAGGRVCFDIDGVICTQTDGDYSKAEPNQEAIALINKLYDEGQTILLFTARFMRRNRNDWKKAYEDGYAFTKGQLDSWGVKYHELFLGKPSLDVVVDDRAIFFEPDFERIEKEIRQKLRDGI